MPRKLKTPFSTLTDKSLNKKKTLKEYDQILVIASYYVLILAIMTLGMLMAGVIGSYGMVRE